MSTTNAHKLNEQDYIRFRDFIAEHAGLHFPEKKRADLERGVIQALKSSSFETLSDFFSNLVSGGANGELAGLISALTIGETYFYRDEGQFQLLEREILPKLIQERISTRRLRIWSAGCATGEEPYSLAIILRELVPYIDTWDVMILATDINRRFLARAKSGRYSQWSFRNTPQTWVEKYFFLASSGEYHLSETVKQCVTFDYLNLKSEAFPSYLYKTASLDLIVCRNVAIYFDQDTTGHMMDRFYQCLAPNGWLLMGASDPIPPVDKFWPRNHSGVFIYQKKSADGDARHQERQYRGTAKVPVKPPAKRSKSFLQAGRRPQKPPAANTITECRTLIEMGQPILAAAKLVDKLKQEPNSIETLLLLAKAELAQGNLQGAEKLLNQVISLDKLNVSAYYLMSAISQGLEDDKRAIDYLKKAIYLDKTFINGHFALGCLYKKQNKTGQAQRAFKNVIRLMVGRSKDEIVPDSNGITYGRLLEIAESNVKLKER